MGLERLSSILQDKPSNYKIDVFQRLMDVIYALRLDGAATATAKVASDDSGGGGDGNSSSSSSSSNIERYGDGVGTVEDPDGIDEAYRVVADHARTLVFAIADKVIPGSAGRGYVLRRILRRGVLYGEHKLGLGPNFFSQMVPHVVDTFREAYPELDAADRIAAIVRDEEELFAGTWAAGQTDFEVIAGNMTARGETVVSGKDAARLHQERGFPIDLTRLLAEQQGLTVDEAAFAEEQRKHTEASRQRFDKSGSGASSDFIGLENCASELVRQHGNGAYQTDDSMKLEDLTRTMIPAKVLAFCELVGEDCDGAERGEKKHSVVSGQGTGRGGPGTAVALALDETPFYSEAGGQVADRGLIRWHTSGGDRDEDSDAVLVRVVDVQARGGILWHMGYLERGHCSTVQGGGEAVFCHLDMEHRGLVSANHTATHLLNFALRESVGGGDSGGDKEMACDQRGSNVTSERLRFDFALDRRVESDELRRVEDFVNACIEQRLPVYTDQVPLEQAMNGICGLRAVFGESYPDPVRAVSIGRPVDELFVGVVGGDPDDRDGLDVSVELCGGTHVQNTGQLKKFALVEERGIAKGVRRVTCLTGPAAQTATEAAERLTALVDALEQKNRPVADLRAAAEALDNAETVIPVYVKAELRARVESLIKSAAKRAAANTKQGAAEVQSQGLDIADRARAEGLSTVVEYIDMDMDPKTARKVLGKMSSAAPNCAFFLAARFKGKIACYATGMGGDSSGQAVDASAWVKSVIAACPGQGGKGGGRQDFAQGNGIAAEDLEAVIEEAQAFASLRKQSSSSLR